MTQTTQGTRVHVPEQRRPRPLPPVPPRAKPQRSVVWKFRTPKPIAQQRKAARRASKAIKPRHRRRTWWNKLWGRG